MTACLANLHTLFAALSSADSTVVVLDFDLNRLLTFASGFLFRLGDSGRVSSRNRCNTDTPAKMNATMLYEM